MDGICPKVAEDQMHFEHTRINSCDSHSDLVRYVLF